jgi:magnesium transporter
MGMPPPAATAAADSASRASASSSRRICAWVDHPDDGIHEEIPPAAISDALENPQTRLWLDITDQKPEDTHLLLEEFGLHPLALEEITSPHARPKCVEFDGLYVLVMYAADAGDEAGRKEAALPAPGAPSSGEADDALRLRQVVIYIGRNYLITAHEEPFPEIDECVSRWRAQTGIREEGIAAPLYSLLDTLVDGYFPLIDAVADRIEELEERIYGDGGGPADAYGPEIFRLKKVLLSLRRVVAGQRDALNLLLRQDVPVLPPSSLLFFQSVYDHLVRLVESIDTYRDLLSSAMDMHLSILSNRMNQVMKTLTAISTCLMSAALISGIYGMNFKHMPELGWEYGYPMAIGSMVLVASGLLWYFRRIKWI